MKLKNNLYTVERKQLEGLTGCYELKLNPDSFIYQAHFPGEPITPGVCIVQIGKELVEDALGKALEIKAIKNVKFLSVISPRESASITYVLKKVEVQEGEEDSVKVQLVVTDGVEPKAKISFVLSI